MTDLFFRILEISITAGFVAVAVMFLRLVFKRTPRWISCVLWALVALRLLCPVVLESEFSLIPDFASTKEVVFAEQDSVPSDNFVAQSQENLMHQASQNSEQGQKPVTDVSGICTVIWLGGMGIMFLYGMVSYLSMRHRVCDSVPLRENIRQSEKVNSPFILGIFRPHIYIPFRLDPKTEFYVLAHEQAHLKRLDHIWKPLGFVLLCIHWFNPLMWVSYVLLCRDIEVACDEKVVCKYNLESRKSYATALLDCKVSRRMVSACPVAFGEVGVGERIKKTLKYRKSSPVLIAVSVLLVLAASACLLTDPIPEVPSAVIDAPAVQMQGETETDTPEIRPVQTKEPDNSKNENIELNRNIQTKPEQEQNLSQVSQNDSSHLSGNTQQDSSDVSDHVQNGIKDDADIPVINTPEVVPQGKPEGEMQPSTDIPADVPVDVPADIPSDVPADIPSDVPADYPQTNTQQLEAIPVPQRGMDVEKHFDSSNNELLQSLTTHILSNDELNYNDTGYLYWE